ncbi:hypothetical protein BJ973_006800 [Actinoplanes tereljensis]|uniref:neprosin family prolyl endopeptidase n=1 Tax=Paractinoplanes tereljensis TaxID=571912 RepID=UPI001EF3595B|nr:neprosin family prolyl endopeptidase [Actinoplanes tereljensis]
MLKSRRGLLAAGLAVAVVGAIGVASTLNAGAEQITGAPDQTVPVADSPTGAIADTATPPALLPWGERPTRIRKGRAGADSKTLRAAGVAAASADTTGSILPRGRYAPKGRTAETESESLLNEKTDVPPPLPPSAKADGEYNVDYIYSTARQDAVTDGVYSTLTVAKPTLGEKDYHSLAEIALQSADSDQVVEVGWTVDPLTNKGSYDPHFFVYHWVNGEETCYNGCGWVQFSKNLKPGDTLAYGAAKKFGIQYSNGSWWVAFDSEWIGYFPESLWNEKGTSFSQSGLIQLFGEIAVLDKDNTCTLMGNGNNPVDEKETSASAFFTTTSYINGPALSFTYPALEEEAKGGKTAKELGKYGIKPAPPRSFRYGGDGKLPDEDAVC